MGSHSICVKKCSFSASLDLDITQRSPLTQVAMALAETKISRLKTATGLI